MERRREALISSYTRWASRCDGRRKRHQARTVGVTSFYDDSSTQTTAGVALDERGAAAAEMRKQGTSEVGTLVVASDYRGRTTTKRSTDTARNGRNDRALVLFSPSAGASRHSLLHQSLRRARVTRRGNIMYDLSRGVSPVRGTSPFRGLPPFYGGPPPQPEPDVLHAPPPVAAEVTERALAVLTGGHDCVRSVAAHPPARGAGERVVACAAPASGMLQTKDLSTLEVAGRSSSNACSGATAPATAPGWPEDTELEIEHPLEGSSLDIIPSGGPVIGADRYSPGSTGCSIVQSLPSAAGRFAGEHGAGEGHIGQRTRSDLEGESLPTLTARFRLGSGTPAVASGGSYCRDLTVWTRATASEGRIAERNVCTSSGPATGRKVCVALPSSTESGCRNTTSAEEKQMVVRSSPDHRNRSLSGNLDALAGAENDAVAMALVPRLPNTDGDEQQQMTPFQGYGGIPGAGAEHTTVVLPARTHSGIPQEEAARSKPRQVGSDQCNTGGGGEGGGRLLLCGALPRGADDVNAFRPSPPDIFVRQRRIGQSATPRGSHLPSNFKPAVKITDVDSVPPDGETRIVSYAKVGSAARTCTSGNEKDGAEGELLHPSLALQGKGDGRWSEPGSNSGGGVGTRAHQQDLGQVEVPLPCSTAIVPRSCTGEGVAGLPNAVDLFQAKEPAKPACLHESANRSRRRDDTQVPTGAESRISSEIADVFAQGDISVAGQQEGDDEARRLDEKVVDHAVDDNKPEGKSGVLSTTRERADSGELRASIEQKFPSVSPPEAPGNLPVFPEGPQPQTKAQPSAARGTESCGLATPSPQELLLLSPPGSSSPLPLEALGESAVRQTDHDDPDAATTEPASAAPVKGTTRRDSTTKSTPPAAPPSTGFAPQPPLPSPLPRSPPPLRPKQSSPPTIAVADGGAEPGSSIELFSTDTALCDTDADGDDRVSSARAVHRRRHEDHGRRRPELCAAGHGRAEEGDIERGCQTPACM